MLWIGGSQGRGTLTLPDRDVSKLMEAKVLRAVFGNKLIDSHSRPI